MPREPGRLTSTHRTGAYRIRNLLDGKVYVGGAYKSFDKRMEIHWRDLRRGKHANKHLQGAWTRDGEENFVFEVLERCPPEVVAVCEQKWIDFFRATDQKVGYNFSPTAGSTLGVKHSEESRRRMSEAHIGKPISPEQRERMVAALQAVGATAEFREKMRAVNRETASRPEVVEKRKELGRRRKGVKLTDEHREAIRLGSIGRKLSEETRKKISETQKGKVLTEDHRKHIGESLLGKKASESRRAAIVLAKSKLIGDEEFSERMRAAAKIGWENRRRRQRAEIAALVPPPRERLD